MINNNIQYNDNIWLRKGSIHKLKNPRFHILVLFEEAYYLQLLHEWQLQKNNLPSGEFSLKEETNQWRRRVGVGGLEERGAEGKEDIREGKRDEEEYDIMRPKVVV